MSVYVDVPMWPFRGMLMCHMTADTTEELLAMAAKLGLRREWIQYPGDPTKEHFDISKSKRALAVKYGAIELNTIREAAEHIARRRETAKRGAA